MPKLLIMLFLALTATGQTGCGTLCNGWNDPALGGMQPYGGVGIDLKVAKDSINKAAQGIYPASNAFVATIAVADLPLSSVGDTLTLPDTLRNAKRTQE